FVLRPGALGIGRPGSRHSLPFLKQNERATLLPLDLVQRPREAKVAKNAITSRSNLRSLMRGRSEGFSFRFPASRRVSTWISEQQHRRPQGTATSSRLSADAVQNFSRD